MNLHFLGSGDAFGSGGRLNACFFVDRGKNSFLIDCGASAMISMRRFGIDPNQIGAIILSHLHGDHFGGLPFFILDAQLVSGRTQPVVIVGPPGLAARLEALMEACFPGSSKIERKFRIDTIEINPEETICVPGAEMEVTGYLVRHPSGSPAMGLRVACDGRVLAYTGDTEWVDTLIQVGRDADVLIAEAYTFDRRIRFHLDFATLREKQRLIGAKRTILTHMSQDML